jgi:hypothetical protein
MATFNRLDLETLGSWPIMPQILPGHSARIMLTRYEGGN